MYIVVKVKEREIRRLGMFHRQADAKNFLERDFRKSFLDNFGREFAPDDTSNGLGGIGNDSAWLDTNNANLDWKILSADQTFYYTFGSDGRYPFQNGWVTVTAETMKKANGLFQELFPCRTEGLLNCAFVYTEAQWQDMDPEHNWDGYRCYGEFEQPEEQMKG